MNDFSSNHSDSKFQSGSSSPSKRECQYRSICDDLRTRLKLAQKKLDEVSRNNKELEQQVSDSNRNIDEIEFEKKTLMKRNKTLEEHMKIITTKNEALKKELEEERNKKVNVEEIQNEIDEIGKKFQKIIAKKKKKIHRLKEQINSFANIENNANETLTMIQSLQNENISLKTTVQTLKSEITSIETQKKFVLDQLESANKQIQTIYQSQESTNNQMRNDSQEFIQLKINVQSLQQQNDTNKITIEQQKRQIEFLTEENQKITVLQQENEKQKRQIKLLRDYEQKINQLTTDNKNIRSKLLTYEQTTLDHLTSKPVINAQHEVEVKTLQTELNEARGQLHNYHALRVERDTLLQDVTLLEEKITRLKNSEKQNTELKLRVDYLTSQLTESQQREERLNANVQCLIKDRNQLEVMRNKLLRIEDQVIEHENKEMQLQSQINFYKAQSKEQKKQIDNLEDELHLLQTQFRTAREAAKQKEERLKQKNKSLSSFKTKNEDLILLLEKEKQKTVKQKTTISHLTHQVERYKTEMQSLGKYKL